MAKGQLESLIETERNSVRQMKESLAQSHRSAERMERSIFSISSHFERIEERLQPFFKGMQAAIVGENCTAFAL
jgi:hypothetical protein